MSLPAFPWRYTTDKIGAVGNRLLGMKGALLAGKSLTDHSSVFINQDCHLSVPAFNRASLLSE
jgi:hypothetical protein